LHQASLLLPGGLYSIFSHVPTNATVLKNKGIVVSKGDFDDRHRGRAQYDSVKENQGRSYRAELKVRGLLGDNSRRYVILLPQRR
jgi:hypothetical protein